MLNKFLASLNTWVKSPPFFMTPGHFTVYQLYRPKVNDHQLYFPWAYGTEVNYSPSLDLSADNLSSQGHISGIWDKGYQFISVNWSCPALRPHELQHVRPPCPSSTPGVHPNPCPSSQRCHPTISSSVVPLSSCPQSFQHQGLFK